MRPAASRGAMLRELAGLRGVQTSYTKMGGGRRRAGMTALEGVLRALGCDVEGQAALEAELKATRARLEAEVLPPVLVRDRGSAATVSLPQSVDLDKVGALLVCEDGSTSRRRLGEVVGPREGSAAGGRQRRRLLLGRFEAPVGYHRLHLEGPRVTAEALVLAPGEVPRGAAGLACFAPLFWLRSENDWGVGTFSDLGRMREVCLGGSGLVGSLPLYASAYDVPGGESPYLPLTRLAWNEVYLDVEALEELSSSPEARELIASAPFVAARRAATTARRVDYREVMARKRRVLELLSAAAHASPERRSALTRFCHAHPEIEAYARFRAACEQTGSLWRGWGTPPGRLPRLALEEERVAYHRYVQWACAEQLSALPGHGRPGEGLYLDLPIGVHPDGFDTWHAPRAFASGAQVGAPPDAVFTRGQAWALPPPHPDAIREDGYGYLASCYRATFPHAGAVRLDHVMGLQRLWWVPEGHTADDGAYVRYHTDELAAVVRIEAARAATVVIGEDLGTVSPGILAQMDRSGFLHSFVYQLEASPTTPLPAPREPVLASFGTHDMTRFAAYFSGTDITRRLDEGLLDARQAKGERARRSRLVARMCSTLLGGDPPGAPPEGPELLALYESLFQFLARSEARYVLVDLGDLFLEEEPVNLPGVAEEANWRRRASRTLDELAGDARLLGLLEGLRASRSLARSAPGSTR